MKEKEDQKAFEDPEDFEEQAGGEDPEASRETGRNRRRIRNDCLLIGIILLATAVALLIVKLPASKQGTKAVVTLNGTTILEQDLSEDCTIPIQTDLGYNIFQVKDGQASITEADCRNQICVEHEAISKTGETITCLPHYLIVEIQE